MLSLKLSLWDAAEALPGYGRLCQIRNWPAISVWPLGTYVPDNQLLVLPGYFYDRKYCHPKFHIVFLENGPISKRTAFVEW